LSVKNTPVGSGFALRVIVVTGGVPAVVMGKLPACPAMNVVAAAHRAELQRMRAGSARGGRARQLRAAVAEIRKGHARGQRPGHAECHPSARHGADVERAGGADAERGRIRSRQADAGARPCRNVHAAAERRVERVGIEQRRPVRAVHDAHQRCATGAGAEHEIRPAVVVDIADATFIQVTPAKGSMAASRRLVDIARRDAHAAGERRPPRLAADHRAGRGEQSHRAAAGAAGEDQRLDVEHRRRERRRRGLRQERRGRERGEADRGQRRQGKRSVAGRTKA
jgi:hypothetical protein